ncbi:MULTISPECIES: hypothetical protein [unclassified Curtobacterium]|uniref:hypothetical protein n=1 Tax=unclassified Curtobacterium TaxID=257496 RepID=UPI003A7F6E97
MMRAVILVGVAVGCVVAIAAIVFTIRDIRAGRSMSRRAIGTFCAAGLIMSATIAYAVATPASS